MLVFAIGFFIRPKTINEDAELAKLLRLGILEIVEINTFDFDRPSDPDADVKAEKQSR